MTAVTDTSASRMTARPIPLARSGSDAPRSISTIATVLRRFQMDELSWPGADSAGTMRRKTHGSLIRRRREQEAIPTGRMPEVQFRWRLSAGIQRVPAFRMAE